jgi:hypothetical protein
MTKINGVGEESDGLFYEIKIKGQLEEHWSDWLGGLEIAQDEQGNSLLTGFIPDQAALHGILAQIRDLGLNLISIAPKDVDAEPRKENENTRRSTK